MVTTGALIFSLFVASRLASFQPAVCGELSSNMGGGHVCGAVRPMTGAKHSGVMRFPISMWSGRSASTSSRIVFLEGKPFMASRKQGVEVEVENRTTTRGGAGECKIYIVAGEICGKK